MNVAASFNKKYVDYAIVLFTSFCINNPEHNRIFVLHSELEKEDLKKLRNAMSVFDAEIIELNVSERMNKLQLPVTEFWSKEIYYRLMLPEILPPDVDRILYMDVDVIVHGPVDELYYSDFEGMDLMAADDSNNTNKVGSFKEIVREKIFKSKEGDIRYFNSGILVMNIEKMRHDYPFEVYLRAMEEWDCQMSAPDQDILNYVHYGKVKFIPWEKYDLFAKIAFNDGWTYEDVKNKNMIIHFAGAKPWNFDGIRYEIERFWWEYAAKTPIYQRLMERFLEDSFTNNSLEKEAVRLCAENEAYAKAINEANDLLNKFGK